jgi:hypothetical protein
MTDEFEWIRRGPTTAVTMPPSRFGVVAVPLDAPNETKPLRSGDVFAQFPNALVALNGPQFARCSSDPGQRPGENQPHFYARLRCNLANFAQHDPAEGVDLPGSDPRDGITIAVGPTAAGIAAHGSRGDTPPPEAAVSVQLYPPLIAAGRVVTIQYDGHAAEIVWRCAAGIRTDGRIALLATKADMRTLQSICTGLGLVWAGYTDGGGSADLSTRDGMRVGSTEHRPVGSWLVGLAPTATDSAADDASTHPLAVGAAVIVAGVGAWMLYNAHARKVPKSSAR